MTSAFDENWIGCCGASTERPRVPPRRPRRLGVPARLQQRAPPAWLMWRPRRKPWLLATRVLSKPASMRAALRRCALRRVLSIHCWLNGLITSAPASRMARRLLPGTRHYAGGLATQNLGR